MRLRWSIVVYRVCLVVCSCSLVMIASGGVVCVCTTSVRQVCDNCATSIVAHMSHTCRALVAQHRLWREHDQRAFRIDRPLATQQVKVLGGVAAVRDRHVAGGTRGEVTLGPGTRVFGSLTVVAVW